MSSESGSCPVPDGELRVERSGAGPALLLISGGTGAAASYRALARRLAENHTVLGYDRRGHFGSTDATTGPLTVARHADDARAVIEHFGYGKALVFGSSAGGNIGLELAIRHPDVVSGLVVHEPPAVRLLPDADEWIEFAREQASRSAGGDLFGAFSAFIGSIAGAGLPPLKAVRLPNEHEWRLLFDRELVGFYEYLPDLGALRRGSVPVVLTAGEGSRGYYHYRPARALALELGLPFVELPGAHLAPQRDAKVFAGALTDVLTDLVL
ncbi:pimeloyl-ACP methyl ester carboxylesterase [Amycolatopsis endophytica]|uniref:Pimeloyl-ACP methyl ester carboxylesterase n=1 Tax=Amycolatopsis endophytica TaxID=860233 RepID=A0A853B744_9PSEU|nr:alpha/beta fold hydrolase [Amycolatopsis endophytica]NYI90574.1 pimeloyl-ACP methyl ester carboxylesterase [Amycolatopsis endophytica]